MGFCQLSDACIRDASVNEYKVYLKTVFLILQELLIFLNLQWQEKGMSHMVKE